jgi:integrase
MASVWIARRPRKSGGQSFRVMFRVGGRESMPRYGGAFSTMREAKIRRDWIAGELAGRRVPATGPLVESHAAPTLEQAYEAWRSSRVDVTEVTATYQRSAIRRAAPLLGRPVDAISSKDVAALVGELVAKGKARETVRKTVTVLAMVLDHAGVTPNPARDRVHVRLPREERPEIQPPSAEHVEAVHRLVASAYRLPLLVLDATGMRVGELEALTWGDVDEPRGRWRVSRSVAKTGRARWVNVAPVLFEAVGELCPRDDRHPDRRVFENMTADRLRTAISRACTAAGVPVFSPHDLRHRRISLLHLSGVPWATIGQGVGQRNLAVTANTYTHVLADERELDYANLLAWARSCSRGADLAR